MRLLRVVTLLLVGLSLVGTACTVDDDWRVAASVTEHREVGAFYDVPDPLPPGEPGELIRSEVLLGAPQGARAWRVLYHSRDEFDRDIAVSGVVLAPDLGAAGEDRAVVSWGHPTNGAARQCAPSLGVDPFDLIEGATALLHAGYVVAATDYPGMGARGPDSYLVGINEGRAVLDAARAARALRDTGAGDRLLLWGHSQGGQAALFAAQQAPDYAPELRLDAVAVAAPAVELATLLRDDAAEQAGVSLGSYAFHAYDAFYGPSNPGMSLEQILEPDAIDVVPQIADLCLFGQHKEMQRLGAPYVGRFIAHDPATVEPWAELLQRNTPGAEPLGVPVLVAQGEADQLVDPSSTAAYVEHLCTTGEQVDFRRYAHIDHGLIATVAVPEVLATFRTALEDAPPTNDC
jgi:pimeloyl-ACP methyl ester carboxylesterase